MNKFLLFLSVCTALPVFATSPIEQGRQLYISAGEGGCATCHGKTGNEPVMPMYPKIGGQTEMYLFNQLKDYKLKKRKNGLFMTMEVAMEHYSDEEMKLMAKYLASIGSK